MEPNERPCALTELIQEDGGRKTRYRGQTNGRSLGIFDLGRVRAERFPLDGGGQYLSVSIEDEPPFRKRFFQPLNLVLSSLEKALMTEDLKIEELEADGKKTEKDESLDGF